MSTCRTCEIPLDCETAQDIYSLQEDTYFYTFAEPGNPLDTIYMDCCDGVRLRVVIPASATQALRDAIMQQLVAEYWRRWLLCLNGGTETGTPDDPDDPTGNPVGDPTDPDDPLIIYRNKTVQCTTYCSDGAPFTWTIPPGRFIGVSQAGADTAAHNMACELAKTQKVCFGALQPDVFCVGDIQAIVRLSGTPAMNSAIDWDVIAGALPTGTHLRSAGRMLAIEGTATTSGTFTFTIRAVIYGSEGTITVSKEFSICMETVTCTPAGIDHAHFPNATVGEAYQAQLEGVCLSVDYTFEFLGMEVIHGLTGDALGRISGTPEADSDGTFAIVVRFSNDGTTWCEKEMALTIEGSCDTCSITVAPAGEDENRLPDGEVGTPYSAQLGVDLTPAECQPATPAQYVLDQPLQFPPGLALNETTGQITGTPTEWGMFCVPITYTSPAP